MGLVLAMGMAARGLTTISRDAMPRRWRLAFAGMAGAAALAGLLSAVVLLLSYIVNK